MVGKELSSSNKFIQIAENCLFYHSFGSILMKNEKKNVCENFFFLGGLTLCLLWADISAFIPNYAKLFLNQF